MKKLALAAPALLLALAAVAATDDAVAADVRALPVTNPAAANPSIAQFIAFSYAKGTITVPASNPSIPGLSCNDFVVSASSDQMTTRPTNIPASQLWFAGPIWTHTAHATGNMASGSCSYAVVVPPKKGFYLQIGGSVTGLSIHCDDFAVGAVPQQAGVWSLQTSGATQTQNFTVNYEQCEVIH